MMPREVFEKVIADKQKTYQIMIPEPIYLERLNGIIMATDRR